MKRRWGKSEFAWVLEFQKNGTPHLHIWWAGSPPGGFPDTKRNRHRTEWNAEESRRIGEKFVHLMKLEGPAAEASGRIGTCIERIRVKNGAAKYAAKESAKRVQKKVPEWYNCPGKFWNTSRGIKAVKIGEAIVQVKDLDTWEFEDNESGTKYSGPFKIQFNKSDLGREAIREDEILSARIQERQEAFERAVERGSKTSDSVPDNLAESLS